jgi:hypothetical protein
MRLLTHAVSSNVLQDIEFYLYQALYHETNGTAGIVNHRTTEMDECGLSTSLPKRFTNMTTEPCTH